MKTRLSILCLCLFVLNFTSAARAADPQNPHWPQKWNYIHVPFETDKDIDHLIDLLKQSADAGCTHVALGVTGMGRLDKLTDPAYITMAQKVRDAADGLHLQIVPMIFSIGYGGETLRNDGNLMAGMPVKDEAFVIKGTTGEPDDAGLPKLGNWEGTITYDNAVMHSTTPSIKFAVTSGGGGGRRQRGGGGGGAPGGNNGLSQTIQVKPFQYYRVSYWVKASDYALTGGLVTVRGAGRNLAPWTIPLTDDQKAAKDWVQLSVYFNTLDANEITLQLAPRGGGGRGGFGGAGARAADAPATAPSPGTLWVSDIELKPGGLMLALHRDTVPLVVTSEDGKTTYAEGKDYKPVIDSCIQNFPNVGELDITHAAPALTLADGSAIKDGQKVLVSFYNTTRINTDQDVVTMQDPRVLDIWDKTVPELVKVWPAKGYFMTCYDEIRIAGWEPNPGGEKLTPGQILSRHTQAAYKILKKNAPDATVYTWSDMYTPFHNAKPGVYYLCNGNFENAIDGVPTDIGIMNWNLGRDGSQSIAFFADKGFHQVFCGYYDANNAQAVQSGAYRWMDAAAGIKNIDGMMYTTWENKYQFLKDFFKAVDNYPAGGNQQ